MMKVTQKQEELDKKKDTRELKQIVITEISSAQGDKNSASSTQKNSHSWHKD